MYTKTLIIYQLIILCAFNFHNPLISILQKRLNNLTKVKALVSGWYLDSPNWIQTLSPKVYAKSE